MSTARLALVAAVTASGGVVAAEEPHRPFMTIEARLGGGFSLGAGAANTVVRGGPATAGLMLELAIATEPWTTAYVGAFVEGYRGAGLQLQGGLRIRPIERVRISAGLVATVAPYTLVGVSLAPGYCHRLRKARLCADAEVDVMFYGSELPVDRVAIQLQLVAGVGFDVL